MATVSRKKSKAAAAQRRYIVGLAGKSPMKILGPVHAASEKEAEEIGAVEYGVPEELRFKLVARLAGY